MVMRGKGNGNNSNDNNGNNGNSSNDGINDAINIKVIT